MVVNAQYQKYLAENPERTSNRKFGNALPVQLIEPVDVSNALVYLASDEGRYVTGVVFPVDAGQNNQ